MDILIRKALQALLVLVFLAFVISAMYTMWWVITNYPTGTIFWAYQFFLVIYITFYGGFFTWIFWGRHDRNPDDFFITNISASIGHRWLGRVRFILSFILKTVANGITWPYTVYTLVSLRRLEWYKNKRTRMVRYHSYNALKFSDIGQGFTALVLVVLLYIWRLFDQTQYQLYGAFILILHPTFHMCADQIGGLSLPRQTRMHIGNPYIAFLVVSLIYGCVLILGLSAIQVWKTDTIIELGEIFQTSMAIVRLRGVTGLIDHMNLTSTAILSAGCALVYYITIVSTIMRWKEFRRKPEDIEEMVRNLIKIGLYNRALKWLSRIQHPNEGTLQLRAGALFGINRFDEGIKVSRRISLLNEGVQLDAHYVSLVIAQWLVLPDHISLRLVNEWLTLEPEPGQLMSFLLGIVEISNVRRESVERLLSDPEILKRPVHRAALLIELDRENEAHKILMQACPKIKVEEAFRLLLLFTTGISATTSLEQDKQHATRWLNKNLKVIDKLLEECFGSGLIGFLSLLYILKKQIEVTGIEREKELDPLITKARTRVQQSELGDTMLSILDVIKKKKIDV